MARTIKLLDGQSWDYNELLEQMLKDEFYYDYLGKAALSSSSLKKLLQSRINLSKMKSCSGLTRLHQLFNIKI